MRVTATGCAVDVLEEMGRRRPGTLTVTIGTGCCESTAPFLYEDFWPGPDQEQVGDVAGIAVLAPEYLRRQYPGDDALVIDVVDELGESLSVETELGCRFVLRGPDFDPSAASGSCPAPRPAVDGPGASTRLRPVVGRLPEQLRGLRMR